SIGPAGTCLRRGIAARILSASSAGICGAFGSGGISILSSRCIPFERILSLVGTEEGIDTCGRAMLLATARRIRLLTLTFSVSGRGSRKRMVVSLFRPFVGKAEQDQAKV